MSEAVVDDIVAVLPPLLQSLESLGFVARHLNPPDFGRVMEAAGDTRRGVARGAPAADAMAGGIFRASATRSKRRAMRRWRHSMACAKWRTADGDLVSVFKALRYVPRAQEALYALSSRLPPVSEFFVDPDLRDDAELRHGSPPCQRQYRHLSRPQRARQPRRLLALRAGILHARPRLAAGDGAARWQRQRPRLSLELAARCPQPRRHPDRADRDRHHTRRPGR